MKGSLTLYDIGKAWFEERLNFFSADNFLKPLTEHASNECNWSRTEKAKLARILKQGGNQLDLLLCFENEALVEKVIEKVAAVTDVNSWYWNHPFVINNVVTHIVDPLIGALRFYPHFASFFIKAGARAPPNEICPVIRLWTFSMPKSNAEVFVFCRLIEEIAKAELLCFRHHRDWVSTLPLWQQSIFIFYNLRQILAAKSVVALYATLTRQHLAHRDVARLIAQELWKHRYDSKWGR